jgi:hypothetical protein
LGYERIILAQDPDPNEALAPKRSQAAPGALRGRHSVTLLPRTLQRVVAFGTGSAECQPSRTRATTREPAFSRAAHNTYS